MNSPCGTLPLTDERRVDALAHLRPFMVNAFSTF